MPRKSRFVLPILCIVACLCLGCKRAPQSRHDPPTPARAASTCSDAAACTGENCAPPVESTSRDARRITVDLKLPKGWQKIYAPSRAAQGQKQGCPASQMSKVLGVTFSSSHGCVIGSVDPKGNAARAGLQVGDAIRMCNDGKVACPATLDPLLWISRNDTAKLVVARPKAAPPAGGESK